MTREDKIKDQPSKMKALTLAAIIALGFGVLGFLLGIWNSSTLLTTREPGTQGNAVQHLVKYTSTIIPISGEQTFAALPLEKETQIDHVWAKYSGSAPTVDINFIVTVGGVSGKLDPVFWNQAMTSTGSFYWSDAANPEPRTLINGIGNTFALDIYVQSAGGTTNYTIWLFYTTFE